MQVDPVGQQPVAPGQSEVPLESRSSRARIAEQVKILTQDTLKEVETKMEMEMEMEMKMEMELQSRRVE